ncbi:MAG TPA: FAD-dependent oxidoreductase [Anaerolineales bacterium]|nr:FAD-dependent oxidoreductase [Anaerolineales bacterium]
MPNIKDSQIVIIGGGIAGCSIAYYLAKLGRKDVLLLDKGELTSGSTWHAAGLLTHFHTSPALMRMRKHSISLYRDLQNEAGHPIGWNEVGSLRVASSRDQFKFLQRQVSMAKAIGLNVEIISPAEAIGIFPHMTDQELYGAIYLPNDGHVDPNGVTMEIARRAREMGVTVSTDTRVTGIELGPRREIVGVHTEHGSIKTEIVINAAGMWGRQVGAMVGVNLPMTPLVHQHLATKAIPGHELPKNTPCLRDPEYLFYMREEQGGFLIGGFEKDPVAWSVGGVPWDFTGKLLAPDWELFGPIMEGAIRRIPILEQAELMHLVNGPESIAPDSRPLLGPVPGVRGFWAACGLSHTGFGAGGAIGEIIANWIVNGEPPYDVTEMNVRRFGPNMEDKAYAAERARESYRYYYVLRYPHDENEWARPQRLSPLHSRLESLGAVLGEKNGWERVNYFDPGSPGRRMGAEQKQWGWGRPPFFDRVGEEHRAARARVAIWDMTSFGKIDVRGPGALALLQKLCDNDVDKPVGCVVYTQFLNERGGIESDLTVVRMGGDHFRVITGSNFVAGDIGWIRMHLPDDGSVDVREVTDKWATIGLWGPRARDVLQAVTDADVSNGGFPYMTGRLIGIKGCDVWAQWVTYVGELGWELYMRPDGAGAVWDTLMETGKPFGITPAGYKSLDSLRLEKGYRYWSADITPSENPYEAGLGFCVKLNKGDGSTGSPCNFIGREALMKVKAEGVKRKLCTVMIAPTPGPSPVQNNTEQERGVIYGGEAVFANGEIVGRLRSGGYGYTVGKNIAFIYLPLELAKEGTPLEVEVFGERVAAMVVTDVLYDPKGERLTT